MAPNAEPARNQIKPGADEGYAGHVGVLIFALDCSGTVFLEAGTRFYSNDNKAPTPLRQRRQRSRRNDSYFGIMERLWGGGGISLGWCEAVKFFARRANPKVAIK